MRVVPETKRPRAETFRLLSPLSLLTSVPGLTIALSLTIYLALGQRTLEGTRRSPKARLPMIMARLVPILFRQCMIILVEWSSRLATPFPFLLFYRVLTIIMPVKGTQISKPI